MCLYRQRVVLVSQVFHLYDRTRVFFFSSSFSVVWLLLSPVWTPHRTRAERTVSFVHTWVWGEAEEPVGAYTLEDSLANLLGGTENLFHHTVKVNPNIETPFLKPPNMQHWWAVSSLCISQSRIKVNGIIPLIHLQCFCTLTLKTFQVEHNHVFNTVQDWYENRRKLVFPGCCGCL